MPIVTNTRKHMLRTSSGVKLQPGENAISQADFGKLQSSAEFLRWKDLGWVGVKLRVTEAPAKAQEQSPAAPPPEAAEAPPPAPVEPTLAAGPVEPPPPPPPASSSRRGRSSSGG